MYKLSLGQYGYLAEVETNSMMRLLETLEEYRNTPHDPLARWWLEFDGKLVREGLLSTDLI